MGTSTSFRAPNAPKWNAFNAALTGGESVGRVVSELFNAGDQWEVALASPAIVAFADALTRLYDTLPDKLREGTSAEVAIRDVTDEATAVSLSAGFSPALAMAQRTFIRVLIKHLDGIEGAKAPNERWIEGRGPSAVSLTADYLVELTSQFARHTIDREAGRMAILSQGWSQDAQRTLAERVSSIAASLARPIAADAFSGQAPRSTNWSNAVHRVFETGRALPSGVA